MISLRICNLPFVCAPQRLIPGSAEAVRLHSRALLAAIGWKPNDNG